MRATAILTEDPHTRWAAPVAREQARANAPMFASRCSAVLLRVTLSLASCPAAAQAKEMGRGHPDEVRRHSLNPRLKPGIDERRAFGFGIQVMRRSPHQHKPPPAHLRIDLV